MTARPEIIARRFTLAAFALCLVVVVLGAYVRLSNAGLGCPDWPGCYGHFTPATAGIADHESLGKAWKEMVHRYAAGTVGLLIVVLAALAIHWRGRRLLNLPLSIALLMIVVVQGLFGMLTVTWQLTPLVVTLHLLFGLTTLSLLWWQLLSLLRRQHGAWGMQTIYRGAGLRHACHIALIGLIALAVQIALGGWTSSNYAAVACPDLPTCQGSWWPEADFRDAFVLWRGLGVNYQGGVLEQLARVAIHFTHRLGALVATLALLWAAFSVLRARTDRVARGSAIAVLAALALQLLIGVSMVKFGFPLWLATAHNAGAALLLLSVIALNRSLRP
ncbi:MAG: COX15/CtaA family protein [Steroidobacteraceae bacterium]